MSSVVIWAMFSDANKWMDGWVDKDFHSSIAIRRVLHCVWCDNVQGEREKNRCLSGSTVAYTYVSANRCKIKPVVIENTTLLVVNAVIMRKQHVIDTNSKYSRATVFIYFM